MNLKKALGMSMKDETKGAKEYRQMAKSKELSPKESKEITGIAKDEVRHKKTLKKIASKRTY